MWQFLESLLSTVPREISIPIAVSASCILLAGGCLLMPDTAIESRIPPELQPLIGWALGIKVLIVIIVATSVIVLISGPVLMWILRAWQKPS